MNETNFSVIDLRCEYQRNPLGVDTPAPRFAWKLATKGADVRDLAQSAFHLQVASSASFADGTLAWDTGKTASDSSVQHAFAGSQLSSGSRYYWRVQVWDGADHASGWSEVAYFEMALDASGWQAQWITPNLPEDSDRSNPAPLLRHEFTVAGEIVSARLYASALGLYDLALNGKRLDQEFFRPGWTSYHKRLQFQTYDVTEYLGKGENAIGVTLGDGWYRGAMGWESRRNTYGDKLALLLQLQITLADGSDQVVISSPDGWRAATGAILAADLYHGERYDARLEPEGWSKPGFDDSKWATVNEIAPEITTLVPQYGPSVRRQETLTAKSITNTPDGETVLDLGQNMVGWARLTVQGSAGEVVTLRFAEVLNPDGTLYIDNLRSAQATDHYTLRGGDVEVWEPRFTYHGFRYIGVRGYPGDVTQESLVGIVLHSEMDSVGEFACSNPLINQLQSNIVWGQKGNFLEVPTDCPQRDERMGWTGDAQVFARTALFNRDAAAFYTRWLRDLAADQTHDGAVAHVVPDVLFGSGAAAWGDAAAIVPWQIYLTQGDTRLLEEQYDSIVAWVEFIRTRAGHKHIWYGGAEGDTQFGDWVAVEPLDMRFPNPITSYAYLCTAFYAYSTDLLAQIAQILGLDQDALYYGALVTEIKRALIAEFVTDKVRIDGNTQTDYVLALQFDLLPPESRAQAARRLDEEVRRFNNHLSTGFVGTPYLCHVLSRFVSLELAYAVLEQESWPGWLYTVKQGATTMWERWDSIRADGSFGDVGMNSFNHYAYGAIGDWLYQVVAGIDVDPMAPGYKRVLIAPQPGGSLTWANASHIGPYGEIRSAWRIEDDAFTLDVTVPPNSEGVVRLPAAAIRDVTESGATLSDAAGVHSVRLLDGDATVEVTVGSGNYKFVVKAS